MFRKFTTVVLGDGGGLYLRVTPAGSRIWVYRYKNSTGQTKWHDLGTYPAKSLAEARAEASALKVKRREGIDPTEERKRQYEVKSQRSNPGSQPGGNQCQDHNQ